MSKTVVGNQHSTDNAHMRHALLLAARNLGGTWPNPAVGCIIVHNGQIVGRGYTAQGGRPHAETIALAQAGERAKGATAYVTLEPCAHTGKTAPCAEALIEAGIARTVIACRDPDSRVNGQGIAMLQAVGVSVTEGVGQAEAEVLNAGFFRRVIKGLPYVAMKVASSMDEKIAYPPVNGTEIHWITNQYSRSYGHLLRAQYDAILTGIGTVLADDPLLTCRLPGLGMHSPVRVVLDRQLRSHLESKLVQTASGVPLWVVTKSSDNKKIEELKKAGVTVFGLHSHEDLSIKNVLYLLGEQGITRVLIEGGAKINASFLQSGLVDKLYWFRAPMTIGVDGLDAFAGEKPDLCRFTLAQTKRLGEDNLKVYTCSPVL